MLRASVFRSTGSTGVTLSVTHALGAVPDAYWVSARNNHSWGTYFISVATAMLTNTLHVCNSINSDASIDVFVLNYQGRLY